MQDSNFIRASAHNISEHTTHKTHHSLFQEIQTRVHTSNDRDKQRMYNRIQQIFSPQNPSHLPNEGFQGDMMLPFVNQKLPSVATDPTKKTLELNISSQLTLGPL